MVPRRSSRRRRRRNEDEERRVSMRAEPGSTDLLPKIVHAITMQEICTKLPWTSVYQLGLLSPAWQDAIQAHEIYNERVFFRSTDKLLAINHILPDGIFGIALYGLQTKDISRLPPIPRVQKGIPESCQCITLDGRLYILGGLKRSRAQVASDEVYMMDLAGQRPWKKCASMRAPRCNFGSGVIEGKIYVCGGSSSRAPVRETEVYDPSTDTWTTIEPMRTSRTSHQVGVLEGELVIYDGLFFRPHFRKLQAYYYRSTPPEHAYTIPALYIEVYNPIDNEWRIASEEMVHMASARLFMIEGRVHAISETEIFVYDFEANSWTFMQANLRTIDGNHGMVEPLMRFFWPAALTVVDDELYVIQTLSVPLPERHRRMSDPERFKVVLNRSRGFGFHNTEMKWETVECDLTFADLPFILPLQL